MYIIQSNAKLKVGEIVTDGRLSDSNAKRHTIPFRVMREVTEQEFKDFCTEQGAVNNNVAPDVVGFYEISID